MLSNNQGKQFNNGKTKLKQKKNILEGYNNMDNMDPNTNILQKSVDRNKITAQNNEKDIQELQQMQTKFSNLVTQYTQAQSEMTGESLASIQRTGPENKYRNKNIKWSDNDTIMYVTSQGVAKPYNSTDIYQSTLGKNGCPTELMTVDIPWSPDYTVQGVIIPTTPSLIVGSPMTSNESCGNAGKNVYVSSLISNPTSTYQGCYNNQPPTEDVAIVPTMNNNTTGGFWAGASSFYNNNDTYAAWKAFDNNTSTFWNSSNDSKYLYNSTTGIYEGISSVPVNTKNSGIQTIKGEFLQINMPNVNTPTATKVAISKYGLIGRPGCCFNDDGTSNGRDPNSWYIIGYDGSAWNEIDYIENYNFPSVNSEPSYQTFQVNDTNEYSAFIIIITVNGNSNNNTGKRYSTQIASWNLYTSMIPPGSGDNAMTSVSNISTFKDCQSYAVNNDYKYFGMNNYQTNQTGQCLVSNDLAMAQSYGKGVNYKTTALWASNTTGNNPGSTVSFTNGSISVLNSSGAAVFATPNNTTSPSSYIGCYGDGPSRAMPMYNNGSQQYSNSTCQQIAQSKGATYYGLQNSTSGQNAQCALSSDITQTKKYGVAKNCTEISDGSVSGGGWSNAVYSTSTPTVDYFLILQDDGNTVIYRGSPSDNQGAIWSSKTNGKSKQANPNFAASKGKYGTNWIPSGSTLAPGDFVGSTDGSIYLTMQFDGNLVLYSSQTVDGCVGNNNKMYGTEQINSLYQIDQTGYINNLGKIGYVDPDLKLHEYPASMISQSSDYTIQPGYDSVGNDLGPVLASTMSDCTKACNNNDECYGFVWDPIPGSSMCYLKNNQISEKQPNNMLTLATRKPALSGSSTCSTKITDVDTIQYNNYTKVDNMTSDTKCGESVIDLSGSDTTKYNASITEMEALGQQIANKMDKMYASDNRLLNKMNTNENEFNKDILKYKTIKTTIDKDYLIKNPYNIKGMSNIEGLQNLNMYDINGILNDTDLRVLQNNYRYIFWSILAVGVLTVTVSTLKR